MSRTPARFNQADLARAFRAAKQAGASKVELHPNGSIIVALSAIAEAEKSNDSLDQTTPIEL